MVSAPGGNIKKIRKEESSLRIFYFVPAYAKNNTLDAIILRLPYISLQHHI